MKPAKLAPKMAEWLEQCDRHGLLWHRPMRSEFRALLRVARAAERDQKVRHSEFPEVQPTDDSAWAELDRALDALRRASGAPRRKP